MIEISPPIPPSSTVNSPVTVCEPIASAAGFTLVILAPAFSPSIVQSTKANLSASNVTSNVTVVPTTALILKESTSPTGWFVTVASALVSALQ